MSAANDGDNHTPLLYPPMPATVEVSRLDRVNFASHQYGARLVDEIAITNTGDEPLRDVLVTLSLSNGETSPWSGRIERITPAATYRLEPTDFALDGVSLARRTEAERTELLIIASATGQSPIEIRRPVDVLAFDEWPGIGSLPELTAAFVTPNARRLAPLLKTAAEVLGEMTGSPALDGYQSGNRTRATHLAEAIYRAAAAQSITYVNPPASFERDGQRVRLASRVLADGLGTCVDLALLLASAWEQTGLHPLVVIVEGHALAGFWTRSSYLEDAAIDDPAQLRNLVDLGEIVIVEATCVTHGGAGFAEATAAGRRRLEEPGSIFCAVDITSARRRGVRPLPVREEGGEMLIDPDAAQAPVPAGEAGRLAAVALAERAEAMADPSHPRREPAETASGRIDRWCRRLLDLTLHNRLINFRETKAALPLHARNLADLEDRLASGSGFRISTLERGRQTDAAARFDAEVDARFEKGSLVAALGPGDAEKRLLHLYRTARSQIEETGANPLYLALGQLRWYETPTSDAPRLAPLVLLPVTLERASSGGGYRYSIRLSDEPLRPNVTLLEKLRVDFGLETTGLEDLPEDERGIDVDLVLRNFRHAIREVPRWEVVETAHLALLSFSKFLMWKDLRDNLDKLRENRLVRHLVEPAMDGWGDEELPSSDNLDVRVLPHEVLCTRDADSSQLAAVVAASRGRTFVLEGPPGTGKSQTIANMIADSLGRGRRVLFVAEKMAALSVVRKRLEQDGLGAYCLELHSAKASKKEVLTQLRTALEADETPRAAGWERDCEALASSRALLNAYAHELHQRRPSGESIYEMFGRLQRLGEGPQPVPDGDKPSGETDAETLSIWRRHIERVTETAAPIDPPAAHPLRELTVAQFAFGLREQALDVLSTAARALAELADAALEVLAELPEAPALALLTRRDLMTLVQAAHLLARRPSRPVRELLDSGGAERSRRLAELAKRARANDERRTRLLQTYREELLEIEHLPHLTAIQSAQGKPAVVRWLFAWMAVRPLRSYARQQLPALAQLHDDLEEARQARRDAKELADHRDLLGPPAEGETDPWAPAVRAAEWANAYRPLLEKGILPQLAASLAAAADRPVSRAKTNRLVEAWQRSVAALKVVDGVLQPDASVIQALAEQLGWIDALQETLSRWQGGAGNLNNWTAWRTARTEAAAAGLAELVRLYESGEIPLAEFPSAFERGYGRAWLYETANASAPLRTFNATAHEAEIDRFRRLDQATINGAGREVIRRLHAAAAPAREEVEAASAKASRKQSEQGILRRELEKKTRHLPTRQLLLRCPNLVTRLKPCFLMSPLSVAQYLDANFPRFDLVIFDEASQIPVWDAIGAIARGTDVVVVGDSKQLPPTNFFGRAIDDGDEIGDPDEVIEEDMESILQECTASSVPSMRLAWHYRSRHESLITFSNYHYYDNRLNTFPSPYERSDEVGVSLRFVENGIYDRGKSATNQIEAREVVDEIVSRLTHAAETGDDAAASVGIVTFNSAQQSLIEDLLDEKRRQHNAIDRFFTSAVEEPVFVKNLENVQGDERDVILFSINFGPDAAGKITMNFGPVGQQGGERRLNVAITRARRQLIVFSSLKAKDIDLSRTRMLGTRHLRTFLDYAERGPDAIAEAVTLSGGATFDSGFETQVWQVLTDAGWQVDTQVGCAGYRIDLAVRDPQHPGRYLLGIECDGASYHSGKTARDRDRLRQAVLEGLGWRIQRVWSTAWWHDRQACAEHLLEAIGHAGTGMHEAWGNTRMRPD